jgi:hypothetical protein
LAFDDFLIEGFRCKQRVTFCPVTKSHQKTPFKSGQQLRNRRSGVMGVHTQGAVPRTAQNACSQVTRHASAKQRRRTSCLFFF